MRTRMLWPLALVVLLAGCGTDVVVEAILVGREMYAVPNTAPLNSLLTSFVVLVISRSHSPHKVAIGFAIGLAIQPILDM